MDGIEMDEIKLSDFKSLNGIEIDGINTSDCLMDETTFADRGEITR